jgi:hypothetical protein
MQDFDRDAPAMTEIFGEIDGRHPAGTELALESVAIGQRGCERRGGAGVVSAQRILLVREEGDCWREYGGQRLRSHVRVDAAIGRAAGSTGVRKRIS